MLRALFFALLIQPITCATGSSDDGSCASDRAQMLQNQLLIDENTPALTKDNVIVMEHILKEAERVEGDTTESHNADNALKDLEHAGLSNASAVVEKDHDAIAAAIERVELSETPEEAADKGELVTSDLLTKLDGKNITAEYSSDDHIVQGDMMSRNETEKILLQLGVKKFDLTVGPGNLWPNPSKIPYCFAPTLSAKAKIGFNAAVEHFTNLIPCIGFKRVHVKTGASKKCAEPGIYVQSSENGCWANVGAPYMSGGEQVGESACNLGPGCETLGVSAHELGHNLGMLHEQSRSDSSQHVRILWQNIQTGFKDQYEGDTTADTTEPYDLMSLMHYGDTAFGKPGKKTMVPTSASGKTMGNRMGLTSHDARQVAKTYSCLDALANFKLCTNKADGCTTEHCICHHGIKVTKGACHTCQPCADAYSNCADFKDSCNDLDMTFTDGTTPREKCPVTCGRCSLPAPAPAPIEAAASSSGAGSAGSSASTSSTGSIANACPYKNDGECDEPTYCSVGTDTTDCAPKAASDSCRYANDDMCDEPTYCRVGTDKTDCEKERR